MKAMSAATLALLAAGQYIRWDLYKIAPAGAAPLYAHDADYNLTVGGQLYQGGLIFKRGALRQTADLSVQTLGLDVSPQYDYPGGPPTVSGYPFLAAGRQGLLDAAVVSYLRLYLPIPTPANYFQWPDLTVFGAVPWYSGVVTDIQVGRQTATLTVASVHELLNVQMPRNLVQTGCSHMLYDAGCGLSKAAFTNTWTVTGALAPGVLAWSSSSTGIDHYYDLGVVRFTGNVTAALAGVARTVRTGLNASGQFTVLMPLAVPPAVGDTFTAVPGCDKLQATCVAKFANLTHFRGMPYVPVPETQYEGGAAAPPGGGLWPIGPASGGGSGGRNVYKP